MSWEKGDLVRLKSGGPDMTVQEVSEERGVNCYWFDGKKLLNGSFTCEALVDGKTPMFAINFITGSKQDGAD